MDRLVKKRDPKMYRELRVLHPFAKLKVTILSPPPSPFFLSYTLTHLHTYTRTHIAFPFSTESSLVILFAFKYSIASEYGMRLNGLFGGL